RACGPCRAQGDLVCELRRARDPGAVLPHRRVGATHDGRLSWWTRRSVARHLRAPGTPAERDRDRRLPAQRARVDGIWIALPGPRRQDAAVELCQGWL